MDWIYWLMTGVGHIGLWCAIFNRTHATAWPRKWRKLIELAIILIVLLPILFLSYSLWSSHSVSVLDFARNHWQILPYIVLCPLASVFFFVTWIWRVGHHEPPRSLVLMESEYLQAAKVLKRKLFHGWLAKILSLVPGNQSTDLSFETYRIRTPKLPHGRNIRICQLSDFHFTGQIDISYFRLVIERVNSWQPDLVFITGDIVDEGKCLDWILPVFEPLTAKYGKFYLLGNHDRRIPSEFDLRNRIELAGLRRSGGIWNQVTIGETVLQIAGNELPWFSGAEALLDVDDTNGSIKILLTHSPDQIDWAKRFEFDLIFAGHTHGGQIRLPIIGPIISPSKYGVRFAGGSFQIGPSVMHVSRGIGGDEPIRLNCPPEIGFFILEGTRVEG